MRVSPPVLIQNLIPLCLVASLGTASAACAIAGTQEEWSPKANTGILGDSIESQCMNIPDDSLDFGSVNRDKISEWAGLEQWKFMTNTDYLAVNRDDAGPAYIRQKFEPTSQGSVRVVGMGVLAPSRVYTLQQSFYLEPGFEWGGQDEGGKLGFGLGGGSTPSGGMLDQDGFTARLMWRGNKDGTAHLAVYAYSSDRTQNLPYGDDYPLQDFQIPVGEWFTVTMEITANSNTGKSDGRVRVWADGELKVQRENIHWQARGGDPVVDHLIYSTFHGGNSWHWSPSQSVYARFGDVCWQPSDYTPAPADILDDDSTLALNTQE